MLDTLRHVDTPEGVELALPVAGPVPRARAWVYDGLIKFAIACLVSIPLAVLGQAGVGLTSILMFFLTWLYPVAFEVLRGGATPGKQIVGLRVVQDDGMPIGWSASLIRSIVGFVDMLPIGYAVGLVSSLWNRDAKRLGDLAAGTVVIHNSPATIGRVSVNAPPLPPPLPLSIEEQRGLVEFAARASGLSRGRLDELAAIAEPLTSADADGTDRLRRLLGQARWVMGDRGGEP